MPAHERHQRHEPDQELRREHLAQRDHEGHPPGLQVTARRGPPPAREGDPGRNHEPDQERRQPRTKTRPVPPDEILGPVTPGITARGRRGGAPRQRRPRLSICSGRSSWLDGRPGSSTESRANGTATHAATTAPSTTQSERLPAPSPPPHVRDRERKEQCGIDLDRCGERQAGRDRRAVDPRRAPRPPTDDRGRQKVEPQSGSSGPSRIGVSSAKTPQSHGARAEPDERDRHASQHQAAAREHQPLEPLAVAARTVLGSQRG